MYKVVFHTTFKLRQRLKDNLEHNENSRKQEIAVLVHTHSKNNRRRAETPLTPRHITFYY